jgi:hypothetical protein
MFDIRNERTMEKNIVLFESSDGEVRLSVEMDGDTVWLSKEEL